MDLDMFEGIKQKLNLASMSKPALIGLAAVLALVAVVIVGRLVGATATHEFQISAGSGNASGSAQVIQTAEASEQVGGSAQSTIFVHVTGAVKRPGLCELNQGARVADAIEASGGFDDDAALDSVNLARVVADGEQIVVKTSNQAVPAAADSPASVNSGGAAGTATGAGAGAATGTAAGAAAGTNPSGLVNINTADAVQLATLPGIGEATAAKIVSDRQANGPFQTTEDLKRVAGIGDKKFESLRDLICV